MKFFSLMLIWALLLLARPCAHAGERVLAPQDAALAGFTPTLNLVIALRDPQFWAVNSTAMSAKITLQGPESESGHTFPITVTGPAGTNVHFTLTLGGAPGGDSRNIVVNLPPELGPASYSATIDTHPEVSDSDSTTGYSVSLALAHSKVAIGAKDNPAHQSTFTATASDGTNGVAGIELPLPLILPGGGQGPTDTDEGKAKVVWMGTGTPTTNAQGQVQGTFTSGSRLQFTSIGYKKAEVVLASASIEQVWNQLEDEAWSYDQYFYYGESSTIFYKMAYTRDGAQVTIPGHSMEPETTTIKGQVWNYDASEDWDGDGTPDGDYEPATYNITDVAPPGSTEPTGYATWNHLVSWGSVSEDDGTYSVEQIIDYDEDFEVDSVSFNLADTNSYGAAGSLE